MYFSEKIHVESKKLFDQNETEYSGVFGIADYESGLRFSKLKMVSPTWRIEKQKVSNKSSEHKVTSICSTYTVQIVCLLNVYFTILDPQF